jgi:hypothetical protein
MVVTTIPSLALICGVLPLAVGEALGTPVLLAATRIYSTTRQRSIAFSIIYMVMNIGYVAAGWIFDYIRQLDLRIHFFGFQPTTYEQLFLVSLTIEVLIFPAIYFLRRGEEEKAREARVIAAPAGFWRGIAETVRQSAVDTSQSLPASRRAVGFARILVFFSDRVSQSHLPADGLCLFRNLRSRAGLSCTCRQTCKHQCNLIIVLVPTISADATIRRLSYGRDRWRHLCGGSFHHVAAGVVRAGGE